MTWVATGTLSCRNSRIRKSVGKGSRGHTRPESNLHPSLRKMAQLHWVSDPTRQQCCCLPGQHCKQIQLLGATVHAASAQADARTPQMATTGLQASAAMGPRPSTCDSKAPAKTPISKKNGIDTWPKSRQSGRLLGGAGRQAQGKPSFMMGRGKTTKSHLNHTQPPSL